MILSLFCAWLAEVEYTLTFTLVLLSTGPEWGCEHQQVLRRSYVVGVGQTRCYAQLSHVETASCPLMLRGLSMDLKCAHQQSRLGIPVHGGWPCRMSCITFGCLLWTRETHKRFYSPLLAGMLYHRTGTVCMLQCWSSSDTCSMLCWDFDQSMTKATCKFQQNCPF